MSEVCSDVRKFIETLVLNQNNGSEQTLHSIFHTYLVKGFKFVKSNPSHRGHERLLRRDDPTDELNGPGEKAGWKEGWSKIGKTNI